MTFLQLLNALTDEYEVNKIDAENDLKHVLEELLNEKLIEVV